jgi:signal transduction histidine kinase
MASHQMSMNGETMRELKHQLRTPINHIIGYSELMIETAGDLGDTKVGEAFRVMQSSGQRLTRQIEQVLPADHAQVTEEDIVRLRASFGPILEQIISVPLVTSSSNRSAYEQDLDRVHTAAESLLCFVKDGSFPGGQGKAAQAAQKETTHA